MQTQMIMGKMGLRLWKLALYLSSLNPKEQRHLGGLQRKRNPVCVILDTTLFKKYKSSSSHLKWLGIRCLMTVQFRYQNFYSWICEVMLSKICAQGTYPVSKICWNIFPPLATSWNKISLSQIIMLKKHHLADIYVVPALSKHSTRPWEYRD